MVNCGLMMAALLQRCCEDVGDGLDESEAVAIKKLIAA
jgi:hypothetical protein